MCLLLEQAEDKVRQHLPGSDPPTTCEDFKFFAQCGAESNAVVYSCDSQESYTKGRSA